MNPVFIRMVLYTVAMGLVAAGFGTFDAAAGTLTLKLDDIAVALAGAGVLNGLVFWKWGKK
jgi:hypothetical protein